MKPDAAARRRLDARLDIAIHLLGSSPARLRVLAETYGVSGRLRRAVLIARVYREMVNEKERKSEARNKNN